MDLICKHIELKKWLNSQPAEKSKDAGYTCYECGDMINTMSLETHKRLVRKPIKYRKRWW